MKVLIRSRLTRFLKWTQRALIVSGVLALSYCGYSLMDGWMFQRQEGRRLEQLLATRPAGSPPSQQATTPLNRATDGLVGRLQIPRLEFSVMVMEGVDQVTLRRAAGHIPGTSLPGLPGNVGVAGHRDTLFRPLRNVHRDDIITLTTLRGEYRYRVVSTQVVGPRQVDVLNPNGGETLTLVTCYPFYFVGSAPNRFIVRAERIG